MNKPRITLEEQAKASLKSLFAQMVPVALGLVVMLALTGGNPPGWLVTAFFFLGVAFVAWREYTRQSEMNK